MLGLGIDLVNIARFKKWLGKQGLLERYFHQDELAAAKLKSVGEAESLAARFAAKEAFGKALGTGLAGLALRDLCVHQDPQGKPQLLLSGPAATVLSQTGARTVHLSLTHEGDYAAAVVVLE